MILFQRLKEILPKWNEILQMAEQVNTSYISSKLKEAVYEHFYALKPLRYKFSEIDKVKYEGYYSKKEVTVCMGEWLRMKFWYTKYGSPLTNPDEFFDIIRVNGSNWTKYVRKPIKDTWSRLVELTRELKDYEKIVETKRVKGTVYYVHGPTWSKGIFKVEPVDFIEIQVETSPYYYKEVRLIREGDTYRTFGLESIPSMIVLEDYIEDIHSIYRHLKERVDAIRKHNEPILKEMATITAPFRLAKEFT